MLFLIISAASLALDDLYFFFLVLCYLSNNYLLLLAICIEKETSTINGGKEDYSFYSGLVGDPKFP